MKYVEGKITEKSVYEFICQKEAIFNDTGIIYAYRKSTGHYVNVDDILLKQKIMSFIHKNERASVKPALINNVVSKLKIDPDLQVDFDKFKDLNQNYLNVSNGVVDLDTGKLLEHDPKKYFTYSLGFNYNPEADFTKCEAFMKFAQSSLNYDIDSCKTVRLLEMLGYIISSATGAEKCFILVGASNSGKSVMLNLVEEVVGEGNTTNIPIDKLGDRFNLGELRYSRVNINREISGSGIRNTDIFKSICSCEKMTGEQKFVAPFSFKCRCKLLFAGNCLPEIKKIDSSNNEAIFNRLCILYFPNSISDADKDLTLEARMLDEKDEIFSAAINYLMPLRNNNYIFTEDAESTKYFENYKESNQALKSFIEDCCTIDVDARVHIKDFVLAFKKYCADNALPYLYTSENINAYVSSIPGVVRKKFRINGSDPLNGFIGLKLNCIDRGQD